MKHAAFAQKPPLTKRPPPSGGCRRQATGGVSKVGIGNKNEMPSAKILSFLRR